MQVWLWDKSTEVPQVRSKKQAPPLKYLCRFS